MTLSLLGESEGESAKTLGLWVFFLLNVELRLTLD